MKDISRLPLMADIRLFNVTGDGIQMNAVMLLKMMRLASLFSY